MSMLSPVRVAAAVDESTTTAAALPAASLAAAWDARLDRALAAGPARLRNTVAWLRHPPRRWLRVPAGLLFVLGGCLAILPVLGLWMLPLGLALLAEDMPGLKGWLERGARRCEGWWRGLRRR